MDRATPGPPPRLLSLQTLGALLESLRADGYRLMGPTLRDGAIVHAPIAGIADLPRGWTEVQEAGTYRLVRRDDDALFGYSVGPQSWKQVFFVPRLRLFTVRRSDAGMTIEPEDQPAPKLALIGARSCDIHAIEIQDRTFVHGPHADPDYAARRQDTFVVAVNCGQAGGTCFCGSMGTGPQARSGYDIALTELFEPHRFLAEPGSERGRALLDKVAVAPAAHADIEASDRTIAATSASMGRRMEAGDLQPLLYRNLEHPQWDDVADRCLSCTNCTLVCPTCFCSTVEDTSDLAMQTAERWRRWDSCFTLDHSYLHGGSVRGTTRSRYRQWLTHKLASWIDQFGTSGCVGCGRCITWCPVGIDITREVAAIRAADGATREGTPP